MIISKKVVATLATLTLGLGTLSGCSVFVKPEKDEAKAGLKETIAYAAYGDDWEKRLETDLFTVKMIEEMTSCVIDESYDELSASALNQIASGVHGKIIFTSDSDAEAYNAASAECTRLGHYFGF